MTGARLLHRPIDRFERLPAALGQHRSAPAFARHPRPDEQQPAPWLASAPYGPPAYSLLNNPGILNPSPSPGPRITGPDGVRVRRVWSAALAGSTVLMGGLAGSRASLMPDLTRVG